MRILILASLSILVGCSADAPDDNRYDSKPKEDISRPDAPQGCPPTSNLTLSVDSYPDPTCYTLQPFRGTAKGADRVVAQGGAGAAQPVTVGTDGKFCIEVLLTPGALNTVTFSPVDKDGCPGKGTVRKIEHKTCTQPDAGVSVINVAQGTTVVTDESPTSGQNVYLVDGKDSTVVEYTGGWGWTTANIWVGIALGQPVEVDRIVVKWRDSGGQCSFGESYKIAVSAYSSPGKMDLNSGTWTLLEDVTAGDGGDDTFSFTAPLPLAQHVALLLLKDACTNWSEGFALEEIEVWAKDPKSIPLPPADRCQ